MKLRQNIESNELIDFIKSLSPDFHFHVNYEGNMIAIWYKYKFFCGMPKGRVPRHDEFSYKGSLEFRGYQNVLQRIFSGLGWQLSYGSRKNLLRVLEQLDALEHKVDYWAHVSDEAMDIEKKKDKLMHDYGVGVHNGVLPNQTYQ